VLKQMVADWHAPRVLVVVKRAYVQALVGILPQQAEAVVSGPGFAISRIGGRGPISTPKIGTRDQSER
jgi:hypothetical protein